MEFFEVVNTQRSIRKFKPDPVPEDALVKMVDAAIRAPSSGNSQPWAWLIVRDATKRKLFADAIGASVPDLEAALAEARKIDDSSRRRTRLASITFRSDVAAAPVIIIPCLYNPAAPNADYNNLSAGTSIYAAVQNLMLAARALGLGTVFTGLQSGIEDLIRREFHLPEGAKPAAFIPVGYPEGERFGPTTRKPVESVTFWDGWGVTTP